MLFILKCNCSIKHYVIIFIDIATVYNSLMNSFRAKKEHNFYFVLISNIMFLQRIYRFKSKQISMQKHIKTTVMMLLS